MWLAIGPTNNFPCDFIYSLGLVKLFSGNLWGRNIGLEQENLPEGFGNGKVKAIVKRAG